MALTAIINEALKDSYEGVKVEELPIEEFREKYVGLKFKKIWSKGPLLGSLPDVENTTKFDQLKEVIVRYIPFNDTANFVDAAVIFDKHRDPIMEFKVYASHFLGAFYVAGEPGEGRRARNIDLIYEDYK